MVHSNKTAAAAESNGTLHLIGGTNPSSSYATVARRGAIFLGIRFSGLTDGAELGVPGTTYVHARIRSARAETLAAELDAAAGPSNVVSLADQQLGLDAAWPGFTFENANEVRASLAIGMFVLGSLADDPAAVMARLANGDVFTKLVDYVIERVPHQARIGDAKVVATWLADQAAPMVRQIKKATGHQAVAQQAQQEFATVVMSTLEAVAPHPQMLAEIYQKHKLASSKAAMAHFLAKTKPTD